MSTAIATDHAPTARARVTQANVIRSEWTKLWSLRSTRWSLLAAVLAQGLLGILIAAVQMNRWTHLTPHDRNTFDSIDGGVGGYHLAQLAIGVLGVMIISSEYSTGMIRSSFMAVPKRLPVLWGKTGVYGLVALVLTVPAALIAFFAGQAILSGQHIQIAFSHAGVPGAVLGAAGYLTLIGLFAMGLGAIMRNTAAGITACSVGITLPTVDPLPTCTSGITARWRKMNGMVEVRVSC